MFSKSYQNIVIQKPKLILTLLFLVLLSFGYFSKDFKLDASSDTLLLENDPDLNYLREVTKRYGSKDFLVLTYTPEKEIINSDSIQNLINLKEHNVLSNIIRKSFILLNHLYLLFKSTLAPSIILPGTTRRI